MYEINCAENEQFKLHADYLENFTCEDFEQVQEPQKPNVMIALKCGREYALYDKEIDSEEILDGLVCDYEWASIGELVFRTSEIACYGYLGE